MYPSHYDSSSTGCEDLLGNNFFYYKNNKRKYINIQGVKTKKTNDCITDEHKLPLIC